MTAVDFLVTNGTVPETWRPQIVKRWRHNANHLLCACGLRWQVGVALKAHVSHFVTRQHSRVRGAMRFVATRTAFQPHGSVLEGERTSLVGVTFVTAWLVGSERPYLPEEKAAMR